MASRNDCRTDSGALGQSLQRSWISQRPEQRLLSRPPGGLWHISLYSSSLTTVERGSGLHNTIGKNISISSRATPAGKGMSEGVAALTGVCLVDLEVNQGDLARFRYPCRNSPLDRWDRCVS